MKRVNHSQLQPEMDAAVQAFRAELVAEREEQERRLRDALDYFKCELDRLKREGEIEVMAHRRLLEILNGGCAAEARLDATERTLAAKNAKAFHGKS